MRVLGVILPLLTTTLFGYVLSNDKVDASSTLQQRCAEKGPNYWCANEFIASSCKATAFCKEHVWKEIKKPQKVEGDLCMECQQYVGTIHMLLSNNQTEAEIVAGMKELCQVMPTSLRAMCTEVIDLYGQQVLQSLIAYTAQPKKFCSLIRLCNSTFFSRLQLRNKLVKTDYCMTCQQFLGTIHLVLSNKQTQQEVITAIESTCTYCPTQYRGQCSQVMAEFAPIVVNWLVSYLAQPKSFCTTIGLCKSKSNVPLLKHKAIKNIFMLQKPSSTKNVKPVEGDLCLECKQYVGTIHMFLANNQTEAEIIAGMKGLCQIMPESEKLLCSEAISLYGKQVLDALVAYTAQPQKFCSLIQLCNTTLLQQKLMKMALMQATDYCMTCQQFLGTIHLVLSNKQTQQEVITAIESTCTYCPTQYRGQCTKVMSELAPMAVNWLVGYLATPKKFCASIGLCKSSHQVSLMQKVESKNVFTLRNPQNFFKAIKIQMAKPLKERRTDFSSGRYCETCLFVFRYVNKMLSGNKTETEIKSMLEESCTLVEGIIPNCKELVEEYADEAIKLLLEEVLEPEDICRKLRLCPAASKQEVKMEKTVLIKKPLENTITCELCTLVMTKVDNALKGNNTEAAIKKALDEVCSFLPAQYSAKCDEFVDAFAGVITEYLIQELAPSLICQELKLCTSQVKKKQVKSSTVCEVCVERMTYLDHVLTEQSTEDEIEKAVESLCMHLPQYINKECEQLVEQYGKQIINFLVQEMDPKKVCTALKLCSSDDPKRSDTKPSTRKTTVKNGLECELCTVVMNEIDNLLKGKTAQEEIEKALDKVCNIVPTKYTSMCDQMVASYSPIIINLLVKELDASLVCKEIKMCASQSEKTKLHKTTVKNGLECELCTVVMNEIDNLLKGKTAQEEIEKALDKVCNIVPTKYTSMCDQMVASYSPIIINLLVKELDPSLVCKEIKLCSSQNFTPLKSMKRIGGTVSCEICQYAMGYLDSTLKDKATEEEIKQTVEKLCTYLPSSVKTECDSLIEQYGDAIISLLVNELEPSFICKELGLCTAAKEKKLRRFMLAARNSISSGTSCLVCEYAMGYLDSQLQSNTTEQFVETEVEKLCSHFESAIKNECDALITEYGKDIIRLIVEQLQPAVICKELKLCS